MKKLLILMLAIVSITPAYADHGRGYGRGGYWGGGWIAPAVIGSVIAYDLTYSRPYPYQVYEQPYPVYIQTSPVYEQPVQVQQPAPSWYYCASAKGYYPYVPNCPEGWKSVPAQPPQAGSR